MEEKKKEIFDNLIQDRLSVLKSQKARLEEQLTSHTGNEHELPMEFAQLQREKIAEVIKEIKILEDEKKQESDSQD